jgi:hypothetical protein
MHHSHKSAEFRCTSGVPTKAGRVLARSRDHVESLRLGRCEMKKIARVAVYVVMVIVLGDLLARYVAALPYELSPLTDSIRFVLRTVRVSQLDNSDDIETLALAAILIASFIFVSLVLWLVIRSTRGLRARSLK